MEEHELKNKIYSYLFYGSGILTLAAAIFLANPYLIAFTSVLLLLSSVYLNSGHIVNNLLLKQSSIIEIYNGYKLSNGLDSVVKRVGDEFYAVSIALLNSDKSISTNTDAIRNLIESLHESFEFSILIREADKKRLVENLDVKRRMKEILLSRLGSGNYDKINALKREIAVLDGELESIRKGGKALDVIIKLSSYSRSLSEGQASREASEVLKRIAEAFSGSLSLDYRVLQGEELLNFVEVHT